MKKIGLLGLCCALAGCMANSEDVSGASAALEDEGGHGGGHGGHCEAAPIMQVGDFDGNGVVGSSDVDMLSAYVEAGDYAAFFDMNVDGVLDGADVSIVARRLGEPGTPRDAQMAELWATVEPYRNIGSALAAGYQPFTPDLQGHGIHFANFTHIYSWGQRGFQPGVPEGLNYTATGELIAAFYYAPAGVDLADLYPETYPEDTYYTSLPAPASFHGVMDHAWHNHVGACFGGATEIPGFDQCMTNEECDAVGGSLWSAKFHMLHVWLFELNECGPFAGIDEDVSPTAPPEPHHMECMLEDVVPFVVGL